MLTNILAIVSITITTNVSEILPQALIADPSPPGQETFAVFHGHWEPLANPQEKWVRTNIVERHTLTFDFEGKPFSVEQSISLTNWTTHFEKRDNWICSSNNTPPPQLRVLDLK